MIIYQDKRKFWRPGFSLSEKSMFFHDRLKKEGYSQRGVYDGSEITVILAVYKNWLTTQTELVILRANYKGHEYQRNYGCLFSDRGLQLICAKFIRDIKSKKTQWGSKD